MTRRSNSQDVAVFTRNHRAYVEDAARLSAKSPDEMIVFRAWTKWLTASRELPSGGSLPIYMATVGGNGDVEYEAELCDVQLKPRRGNAKTERLLARVLKSTKNEGLWERSENGIAKTLYAIRRCRKLPKPFPMTSLVKVSDGERISADYGYSYCVVHSRRR